MENLKKITKKSEQRLNEDICQLSTLCSQNNSQCNSLEQEETSESILRMLQNWNKNGHLEEADVKNYLTSVCIENVTQPEESLNIQTKIPNIIYEKPIQVIRRQCELINNALNVLKKLDNVVCENPLLLQLQLDLEKINVESQNSISFNSTSSQDHINANDSSATLGIMNNCDNSENQTPV